MAACSSILCDLCRNPGRCCTSFTLNAGGLGDPSTHPLEALVKLATVRHALDGNGWPVAGWFYGGKMPADHRYPQVGLPFVPAGQRENGDPLYRCVLLQPDGRCGEYEHRPALCRTFAAGSDPLCGEMQAPPAPPPPHYAGSAMKKDERHG